MKKIAILVALSLSMGLSGCAQTPKDNVKACEIQSEIYRQGMAAKSFDANLVGRWATLSEEAGSMAEPELALQLAYQTDFFRALADPNTPEGWSPSREMTAANALVGDICRTYGFTFD